MFGLAFGGCDPPVAAPSQSDKTESMQALADRLGRSAGAPLPPGTEPMPASHQQGVSEEEHARHVAEKPERHRPETGQADPQTTSNPPSSAPERTPPADMGGGSMMGGGGSMMGGGGSMMGGGGSMMGGGGSMMGGGGVPERVAPAQPALAGLLPASSELVRSGATEFFIGKADVLALSPEQRQALDVIAKDHRDVDARLQLRIDAREVDLAEALDANEFERENVVAAVEAIEQLRTRRRLAYFDALTQALGTLSQPQRDSVLRRSDADRPPPELKTQPQ